MSTFLNQLKETANYTETENGAVALSSTLNAVLDAFGSLAAMKDRPEDQILQTWKAAYQENPELAMRLLFYVRDIRGGQGMRRVFRVIVKNIALTNPQLMVKNLDNFLFFGRGDDVLCLLETPAKTDVLKWIDRTLEEDLKEVGAGRYPTLLAKWLPSINASSPKTKALGKMVCKGLMLTEKEYRTILSTLRKKIGIIETLMSQNKWDQIDFEKVPAKASMIYSDAFMNHVKEHYIEYLKRLANGDAKVNSASLFPVDIIHKVANSRVTLKDKYLLTAMWNALPDYFKGKEETGLCVVDTSGSMWGTPLEVAVSLGMYCADKARGPFHGHFITFSGEPKLQQIIGDTIDEKYNFLKRAEWGQNTNLEAVFDLLLKTAIKNNTAPEDMPSKLYIISDMQFDDATSNGYIFDWYGRRVRSEKAEKPFMATMKEKYAKAGYIMPSIVYWNVDARGTGMYQDTYQGENCCMVSGYSPSLFKSVIEGTEYVEEVITTSTGEKKVVVKQVLDPLEVMRKTLMNERYDRVLL
ncbi:MAG: DUF2828 family protein [Methanobrevibacter sp.]|nr:DUF2828 family protein [Methanobrevibacter sp.]